MQQVTHANAGRPSLNLRDEHARGNRVETHDGRCRDIW